MPQTLAKRLEIIQGIRILFGRDDNELRRGDGITVVHRDLEEIAPAIHGLWRASDDGLRSYVIKYDPAQPRVPPDQPGGRRWTTDDAAAASVLDATGRTDSQPGGVDAAQVISDAAPDNLWLPHAQYAGFRCEGFDGGCQSGEPMVRTQCIKLEAATFVWIAR